MFTTSRRLRVPGTAAPFLNYVVCLAVVRAVQNLALSLDTVRICTTAAPPLRSFGMFLRILHKSPDTHLSHCCAVITCCMSALLQALLGWMALHLQRITVCVCCGRLHSAHRAPEGATSPCSALVSASCTPCCSISDTAPQPDAQPQCCSN
jgi:hypothetical protein